uniref:Uncharacterized protein n=1 Tax=Oryza brachyantha TaxID=4533 RepID=J3LRI4_ORYBR
MARKKTIFIPSYVNLDHHVGNLRFLWLANHHCQEPQFQQVKGLCSMYGKFCLIGHINAPALIVLDFVWQQADCYIRSWLFSSTADDVLNFAIEMEQIMCDLWIAIYALFQVKK